MEDNFDWKCIHIQESTQREDGHYYLYGDGSEHDQKVYTREVELTDGITIELCGRCYAALETWVWENR